MDIKDKIILKTLLKYNNGLSSEEFETFKNKMMQHGIDDEDFYSRMDYLENGVIQFVYSIYGDNKLLYLGINKDNIIKVLNKLKVTI
ncbi:hypothetical protein MCG45_16165 [Clostridium perfringens]|uniref:hypothetical protein n=1 Tax=Clostridium perfringens TaxID=1502 RepID=UPI001F06B206|nr:hypothetical protein [Clostridium perfringens]MCH1964365.1 hypothetical protein [Clostridium perfringens]